MIHFAQSVPSVSPEWVAIVLGFVGLWVRFEHRMTRVETKLELLRKRNEDKDSEE